MTTIHSRPQFSIDEIHQITREKYNLQGNITELTSERDQNFMVAISSGERFVLKVANRQEDYQSLLFQNAALNTIIENDPGVPVPRVLPDLDGNLISTVRDQGHNIHHVRLMTYLSGSLLADQESRPRDILRDVGIMLGRLDKSLASFWHPAARRSLPWSILEASSVLNRYRSSIADTKKRSIVDHFLVSFEAFVEPELWKLRLGIIQNDGNDHNILVTSQPDGKFAISGLLDFGDMLLGPYVYEPAVAATYLMMGEKEPLEIAATLIAGYHQIFPLQQNEIGLIFYLIAIRVATSVTLTAFQQRAAPENDYLAVHEEQAWTLLSKLIAIEPKVATEMFYEACNEAPGSINIGPTALLARRKLFLGRNLSISYSKPLNIVRGFMQYLYDEQGKAYLDGVNNVAHVGHCHPHVVRAGQKQMAVLNTNTRYLHEELVTYAERLCATLPEPLSVVYFVCSGSEANELALRLAMTHTGNRDFAVIDGAYHGNSGRLIEISPYKFNGPGGQGKPEHVHVLDLPDKFRGLYTGEGVEVGRKYAEQASIIIQEIQLSDRKIAAFIAESLLGCGGQIVLPNGYLQHIYRIIRENGGICIADEVQIGFGRVGSHFWGFETQEVVPDIVTMGKPIGNGHPMAAVVTTPEIAASFDNGMEYFNTFGGNPVSCAIGMAVLDVIEKEDLQNNALETGEYLKQCLEEIQQEFEIIGDVRGLGLFVGVELVHRSDRPLPAAKEASNVVNSMRDLGVLLSTDGPDQNVIKIKPPLVFSKENADQLAGTLCTILRQFD